VRTISVVIPTLNRAHLLSRTIDSIESQSIPRDRYTVIVVDNNSTDRTSSVLAEKAARYSNFRFTREKRPGAAATRNAGLMAAEGDLVLFMDDDIEADRGMIEGHLRAHEAHPDASVIGTIRTQWESTRDPFLRYLRDRRIYNPYNPGNGKMDFSCYHTGNVSTPRELLNVAGGFDERFSVYGMEDIELGYRLERLGSRMVPGPDAVGTHHYSPSFTQFAQRCDQAGYSFALMLGLHPELQLRFFENRRRPKWMRPLHYAYRTVSPLLDPLSRRLSNRDEARGTGPVSTMLASHYHCALRYHFFEGYFRFHANGGKRLIQLPPEKRVKAKSKIGSRSVVNG
jgi:glycosyltransferase involved in cell wall biosynthesis